METVRRQLAGEVAAETPPLRFPPARAPRFVPREEERVITTRWGRRDALARRLLAAADALGLGLAFAVAVTVAGSRDALTTVLTALPVIPAWILLFKIYGLYDRDVKRISHGGLDDLPWLFHAILVGTLLLWGYYKLLPAVQLTLLEVAVFGTAAMLLVTLMRGLGRRVVVRALGPERVVIAGTGRMAVPLLRKMTQHPEYGLRPVGLITSREGSAAELGLPVLGAPEAIAGILSELVPDRVVVCRSDFGEEQVLELIETCRSGSIKVSILPDIVDSLGPSVEVDEVEGITLLGVNPPVLSRTSRMLKRALDCAVAGTLLIAFAPLMAVIALAIKLDSPGPVMFRQRRIGRGGRAFELLKFRTMVADAERRRAELQRQSRDPNWLHLDRDPRTTRVGRLLRRMSLDELAQLWNVLRGEMSLVGPRPLIEEEDLRVDGRGRGRLDLTPGITGLWQVLGRTTIPFDEMVKLDYLYVTNWSLWLDIRLALRTLPVALRGRGAN